MLPDIKILFLCGYTSKYKWIKLRNTDQLKQDNRQEGGDKYSVCLCVDSKLNRESKLRIEK